MEDIESNGFVFKAGSSQINSGIVPIELTNPRLARSTKSQEVIDALAFAAEWYSGTEKFQLQTSGSTGKPKTIQVSRAQMQASAQATINTLGLNKNDHSLLCLSTKYIGGKMMLIRTMELLNKCTIIPAKKDPLAKYPTNHDFTFIAMVPAQLYEILNRENGIEQLKLFKAVLIGGATIPQQVNKLCEDYKLPIWQTFGMTETVSHFALRNLGRGEVNYKVHENTQIGTDNRNCLWVKGAITNNQKIQSNDIVDLINPQEFHWLGRFDNVINSGGIKLFPEEIENDISLLMPANTPYFIYGIEDNKWGQKLVLVMETKEVPKDLLPKLKATLGSIKCPKEIIGIEEFVRTNNGKIQRVQTVEKALST